MENCKFEKLNMEINNSNLPVVTEVQPETVALLQSYSSITDEDQYWFQKFLDIIGGLNGSIWSKIGCFVAPIFANSAQEVYYDIKRGVTMTVGAGAISNFSSYVHPNKGVGATFDEKTNILNFVYTVGKKPATICSIKRVIADSSNPSFMQAGFIGIRKMQVTLKSTTQNPTASSISAGDNDNIVFACSGSAYKDIHLAYGGELHAYDSQWSSLDFSPVSDNSETTFMILGGSASASMAGSVVKYFGIANNLTEQEALTLNKALMIFDEVYVPAE